MDYYSILGVNRTATDAELKTAYRKLAMSHHPDKGGDAQMFAQINEAYDTLKDPQRRAQYDNPPQQQFNFGNNRGMPPGFEDMFRNFGFDPRQRMKNKDINIAHTLTLNETFQGKTVIANYKLGNGKLESLEMSIPAGVEHNTSVRFRGYGDNGVAGIPRGDLILKIRIKSDPNWVRDGQNIIKRQKVGAFDCVLGCEQRIMLPNDKSLLLKIPPGTNNGTTFSVGGYGLPNVNTGKPGNAYITVDVDIPKLKSNKLIKELRAFTDKLAK
jgi:DnaJ-class molecular chaperone